jgi:protein-L-isoaspartate(D-aspartate) O-methyltransferase
MGVLQKAMLMLFANCLCLAVPSVAFAAKKEAGCTADRMGARAAMVKIQLQARDITDSDVLRAMAQVPRHCFVPTALSALAYADHPLPIGEDQTISQPYIVAAMTQAAKIGAGSKVLEIGTGSGYQAAVMAALGAQVYTIEIIAPLAVRAEKVLTTLGYKNIHFRTGDGYIGWPEAAPFDAVIVTAAPPSVPQPLIDQLGMGGRLVIPVGKHYQELRIIQRTADGITNESLMPVRFVPMTGEAQKKVKPDKPTVH